MVSSVGGALHWYRRGHGFKSRTGLKFIQVSFQLLQGSFLSHFFTAVHIYGFHTFPVMINYVMHTRIMLAYLLNTSLWTWLFVRVWILSFLVQKKSLTLWRPPCILKFFLVLLLIIKQRKNYKVPPLVISKQKVIIYLIVPPILQKAVAIL